MSIYTIDFLPRIKGVYYVIVLIRLFYRTHLKIFALNKKNALLCYKPKSLDKNEKLLGSYQRRASFINYSLISAVSGKCFSGEALRLYSARIFSSISFLSSGFALR